MYKGERILEDSRTRLNNDAAHNLQLVFKISALNFKALDNRAKALRFALSIVLSQLQGRGAVAGNQGGWRVPSNQQLSCWLLGK